MATTKRYDHANEERYGEAIEALDEAGKTGKKLRRWQRQGGSEPELRIRSLVIASQETDATCEKMTRDGFACRPANEH